MTNNIVAQFSCSLWKSSEATRAAEKGFSVGDFKEYPVVSGSIFNEEYNETLDSGTLVLSQVELADRLTVLKAYDYVRVYDKSGQSGFDKVFLVDNFSEKENNITTGSRFFGYTINLMSETKLLEKIQCPSLTITHKVDDNGNTTKKTIWQYIKQYVELYSPRIKITNNNSTWHYERLIKLPSENDYTVDDTALQADIDAEKAIVQTFTEATVNFTYASGVSSTNCFSVVYTGRTWTDDESIFSYHYRVTNNSQHRIWFPNDYKFGTIKITYANFIPPFVHTATYDIKEASTAITLEPGEYFDFIVESEHGSTITDTSSTTFRMSTTQNVIMYDVSVQAGEFTAFMDKFSVTCADMAFTTPTLRQVLTTLMQQVSCIPVLRNRKLSFLDFKATGDRFVADNTINYIERSLSSDSFANTLVKMSENVLDSGNVVISEKLGFRDKDNSLLKVEENLKLETKFPIYKIEKAILNLPAIINCTIDTYEANNNADTLIGTAKYPILIRAYFTEDGYVDLHFKFKRPSGVSTSVSRRTRFDIGFCAGSVLKKKLHNVYIDENYPMSCPASGYGRQYSGDVVLEENSQNGIGKINGWTDQGPYYAESLSNLYILHFKLSDLNLEDEGINGIWVYGYWIRIDSNYPGVYYSLPLGWKCRIVDTMTRAIEFEDSDFSIQGDGKDIDIEGSNILSTNSLADPDTISVLSYDIVTERTVIWGSSNVTYVKKSSSNGVFRLQGTIRTDDTTGGGYVNVKYEYGIFNNDTDYKSNAIIKADVTKLFVENSVRQYLNTNMEEMNNTAMGTSHSIANLSKFLYGTVGYSIGDKEITGFSDTYTIGSTNWSGWIERNYTYLENMLKYILSYKNNFNLDDNLPGGMPKEIVNAPTIDTSVTSTEPKFWAGNINFDITYQPLNSFNLAYVKSKESIDIPLEQYDGSDSGLVDFDRLSTNEQQQVDRIGNEVLTINQRTKNIADIRNFTHGPLTYNDDRSPENSDIDYIIFKRTFAIKNYYFVANYTGSKDSVLKDYFTSIRTKYRAYQYVDYNQSTLRKEKDVIFIRISEGDDIGYDGDDKIRFITDILNPVHKMSYFVDGFTKKDHSSSYENQESIKYSFELGSGLANSNVVAGQLSGSVTQMVKNDVSKIVNSTSIAFIYEQYDNVGAGPRLNNTIVDTAFGGVTQTWQVWQDSFRDAHEIGFLDKLKTDDYYRSNIKYSSYYSFIYSQLTNSAQSYYNAVWGKNIDGAIAGWQQAPFNVSPQNFFLKQINSVRLPVIEEFDENDNPTINYFHYDISFQIVDDVNSSLGYNRKRTFYQDYAERINHTVQFRYYSLTDNFLWTEHFLRNSSLVDNVDYNENGFQTLHLVKITNQPFEVLETRYDFGGTNVGTCTVDGKVGGSTNPVTINAVSLSHMIKIVVDWTNPLLSGATALKFVFKASNSSEYHDVVAFRKTSANATSDTFSFSLNDTKSDYVLKEKNGMLYRAYKARPILYGRLLDNLED